MFRTALLVVCGLAVCNLAAGYYVKPLRPWEKLRQRLDTQTVANLFEMSEEPAGGEEPYYATEDMGAKDAAESRLPYAAQSIKIGAPPQVVITPEFRHELDDVDPDNWVEVVPPGRAGDPEPVPTFAESEEGEVFRGMTSEVVESAKLPETGGNGNREARENAENNAANDVINAEGYAEDNADGYGNGNINENGNGNGNTNTNEEAAAGLEDDAVDDDGYSE